MKDYLQTVTGPVAREDMGLTLPHEHLFNDLSSVVDAPCYPFSQQLVDKKVTAEIQWALKHDPYCCADNMDRKPIEDVIFEINNFIYSAAIFLIPICISFDTAEKRRYATYLILNRRFSFEF